MKNIGVITNRDKDTELKYTKLLVQSVLARGGSLKVPFDIKNELGLKCESLGEDAVYETSDAIISLGGDGTFLKAARKAYLNDLPILGINLGSLGFLTEVEKNDIDKSIESILQGRYQIEERMMVETSIVKKDNTVINDVALNDIVISRGALSRILHLKTYLNDVFVDSFPGDGLIISTPTGSTAYSLSAGGPIVEPDSELIIVTPICPHILYSRSFVSTGDGVVRVTVDENYGHDAMVTVDGQTGYEITGGDCINVKKYNRKVKIIRLSKRNFYSILRTKIYDRGECLRNNEV